MSGSRLKATKRPKTLCGLLSKPAYNSNSEVVVDEEKRALVNLIGGNSPRIVFKENAKGKSDVWKRFELVFLDGQETKFAACINCRSIYKQGMGTSCLIRHECGDGSKVSKMGYISQFPQTSRQGSRATDLSSFEAIDGFNLASLVSTTINNGVDLMEEERKAIINMIESNSPRISFKVNKRGKSDVWKRFESILMDGNDTKFAACIGCRAVYKQDKGTSRLIRHECGLRDGSGGGPQKVVKSVQQDYGAPSKKVKTGFATQISETTREELARAAVLMSAMDLCPFDVIEGHGFAILAQTLIDAGATYGRVDAKLLLPPSDQVSSASQTMYSEIKKSLTDNLSDVTEAGIACDLWSHEPTMTTYLSVAAQFFTPTTHGTERKLRVAVLSTLPFDTNGCHITYETVAEVLRSYSLNPVNCSYVTCKALEGSFSEYFRVPCSAENVDLLLKHSFEQLPIELETVETLFCICSQLVHYSKECGLQTELETPLIEMVVNNWGTKFRCLNSIKTNLVALREKIYERPGLGDLVDNIDDELLDLVLGSLKLGKELRSALCSDKEPTLHLVLPTKAKLLKMVQPKDGDNGVIRLLKERLQDNIEKYLVIGWTHELATILYTPMRGMKQLMPTHRREQVVRRLKQEAAKIKVDFIPQNNAFSVVDQESNVDSFADFLDFFPTQSQENGHKTADEEVEFYLNADFGSLSHNFDIVSFWTSMETLLPRLSQIAFRLMATPATNLSGQKHVASWAFSGTICPAEVDKLLFVKSNYDLFSM